MKEKEYVRVTQDMFKQTHKLSKFHQSVQHQSGSETSYQNYLYHSKLKRSNSVSLSQSKTILCSFS